MLVDFSSNTLLINETTVHSNYVVLVVESEYYGWSFVASSAFNIFICKSIFTHSFDIAHIVVWVSILVIGISSHHYHHHGMITLQWSIIKNILCKWQINAWHFHQCQIMFALTWRSLLWIRDHLSKFQFVKVWIRRTMLKGKVTTIYFDVL